MSNKILRLVEVVERSVCLLAIKVQFAFVALMQKRLQKQITATLNVRVKSGPRFPWKAKRKAGT